MMASSGPRGKLIELNKRRAKVVSQVCLDGKDLNARAVSQKQCNFFLSFNERESNFVAEQVQFFWHSVRVGTSLIFLLHVSLITRAKADFSILHFFISLTLFSGSPVAHVNFWADRPAWKPDCLIRCCQSVAFDPPHMLALRVLLFHQDLVLPTCTQFH